MRPETGRIEFSAKLRPDRGRCFGKCQHVNSVVYYSYFDNAVDRFLIDMGVLDIHADKIVGLVVDTGCSYFRSISFPDSVHVGVRVAKLGNSSVRYELALYRNDEEQPVAAGHFVHVYVDRESNLNHHS